jgi:4-amino-4-deoxychorismate lyase
MRSEWFHNGEAVRSAALDDRGFQYGDGLFETIAVRHGEPRLWPYHLERLSAGCARLSLQPPDGDALRGALDHALQQASADPVFCVAKIILSGGVTRRGYGRDSFARASTFIGVFPSAPVSASSYRDGVQTILCDTRLAVASPTAGLKTLNRLEQVLARSECLSAAAFEGITQDAEGRVICGTMSNVFVVNDNRIVTPALDRCGVRGVMRRHAMETLCGAGREVEEADLSERELFAADEVFLTNSQFGVLPVHRCDDSEWPVGDVTRQVMAMLADSGIDECRL